MRRKTGGAAWAVALFAGARGFGAARAAGRPVRAGHSPSPGGGEAPAVGRAHHDGTSPAATPSRRPPCRHPPRGRCRGRAWSGRSIARRLLGARASPRQGRDYARMRVALQRTTPDVRGGTGRPSRAAAPRCRRDQRQFGARGTAPQRRLARLRPGRRGRAASLRARLSRRGPQRQYPGEGVEFPSRPHGTPRGSAAPGASDRGRTSRSRHLKASCDSTWGAAGRPTGGHLLALEPSVVHDVEAAVDSTFLLTIGWRGEDGPET